MVIKTKHKIISGVSLLCVIMLLIGIFPISFVNNDNEVDAVEITADYSQEFADYISAHSSEYVYFDISNIDTSHNRSAWSDGVYIAISGSSSTYQMEKVSDTVYRYKASNISSTKEFYFLAYSSWDDVNSGDYRRTQAGFTNFSSYAGKCFQWNGTTINYNVIALNVSVISTNYVPKFDYTLIVSLDGISTDIVTFENLSVYGYSGGENYGPLMFQYDAATKYYYVGVPQQYTNLIFTIRQWEYWQTETFTVNWSGGDTLFLKINSLTNTGTYEGSKPVYSVNCTYETIESYDGETLYYIDEAGTGSIKFYDSNGSLVANSGVTKVREYDPQSNDSSVVYSVTIPTGAKSVSFNEGAKITLSGNYNTSKNAYSSTGSWVQYVESDLKGAKLFIDTNNSDFDVNSLKIKYNDTEYNLTAVSGKNGVYSYVFPTGSALPVKDTLITIKDSSNHSVDFNYNPSITYKNMFILKDYTWDEMFVSVEGRIYFDATLSKLSYQGSVSGDVVNATMPYINTDGTYGDIYCYLYNDSSYVHKTMEKLAPYTKGENTWSDVYKIDLTEEEIEKYTNIIFYSSTAQGTWLSTNGYHACQTVNLSLSDISKFSSPCFYADSSDQAIYNNSTTYGKQARSGYWGEVYTIRDAEKGKSTDTTKRDVVDITTSTFTKANGTLYINSTFYDYYTDYELNGSNRDSYGESTGASQRNWVNFRQFNQALSDYYSTNQVGTNNAIYTGQFQPSQWGATAIRFEDVAGTLNLYGWGSPYTDDYKRFISNNNSGFDITSTGSDIGNGKYSYATQNIVSSELSEGLPTSYGTSTILPYFNEEFLLGNNSKNTVLGEVYQNVAFPFTKQDVNNNGVEYWVFDSAKTTLAMRQDSNKYFLESVGNKNWSKNLVSNGTASGNTDPSTEYGFFPFNDNSNVSVASEYNYGFGTKLEFKFRLTEDGTVTDKDGDKVPIEFEFSGDDDVWVFIDGKLVLDVGGDHGRVTGKINFKDKTTTITAAGIGDAVKKSANNLNGGNAHGTFSLSGSNTDEHTLTMFYMERGMWESNLKLQFNFPDENELQVEKQVDTSDVNQIFDGFFDGLSMFTFNIKNLATHYGTYNVQTETVVDPITISSFDSTSNPAVTLSKNEYVNIWEKVASYTDSNGTVKEDIVKWQTNEYNDNHDSYTEKRTGFINFDSQDISKMGYLSFDVCVTNYDILIDGMYICLKDSSGKLASGYLSGKLHGTPTTTKNVWATFKVKLDALTKDSGFDSSKVVAIGFQYDQVFDSRYWSDVYLDNFVFEPPVKVSTLTGFVTRQDSVPDYGSAASGKLELAAGAQYSSSTGENYAVDSKGNFVLENNETVSFHDQFRRGSYIALSEVLTTEQQKLFTTSYTMYENDQAVTSFSTDNMTTIKDTDSKNLKNFSGTAVDDGRIEKVVTTNDSNGISPSTNNKYSTDNGAGNGAKPSSSTFVFRSYDAPDNENSSTKLKVVYTNKVNVGSITISKSKAENSNDLTGTYTFYIEFSNIGGIGLIKDGVSTVVSGPYTIAVGSSTTIQGIPVGTEYKIHEVFPTDNSSLKSVLKSVNTGAGTSVPHYTGTVKPSGANEAMKSWYITDSVAASNGAYTYNFENYLAEIISLNIQKKWELLNNSTTVPHQVIVQLQRKSSSDTSWEAVSGYERIVLSGDTSSDSTTIEWDVKTIERLEKYKNNDSNNPWTYRIVEFNTDNTTLIEPGSSILYNDEFVVTYNGSTSTDGVTLIVTNKEMPGELILVKKVYNGDTLSTADGDNNYGFTFKVTLTGTGINSQASSIKEISGSKGDGVTEIKDAADITWNPTSSDIHWVTIGDNQITATISVSANTPIKITGIPDNTRYSVIENDSDNNGYKFDSIITTDTTKVVGANETDVVTITNKKAGYLTITKIEQNNSSKVLQGAEFTLYTDSACTKVYEYIYPTTGKKVSAVKTTNEYGVINFGDLPYGTYYLKETKAPAGYQIKAEAITVTVDGKVAESSNRISLSGYDDNKIPNAPITMPETGGLGSDDNGSFNFVLFGAGAIVLASIAFAVLNKKLNLRGRKSSSSKEVQ